MPNTLGLGVLTLSGMGFPLTQLAIRRAGLGGALLVETVCGGLLVRDVGLLASGAPARLRPAPAALLWLETTFAAAAVLTGLRLVLDSDARQAAVRARPTPGETLRRLTLGALFGLHTVRFRIYLQPDRGRRLARSESGAAA
jgi:hypothetical protein